MKRISFRSITNIGPTFVTTMNKLLFYVDFIHYKSEISTIENVNHRLPDAKLIGFHFNVGEFKPWGDYGRFS